LLGAWDLHALGPEASADSADDDADDIVHILCYFAMNLELFSSMTWGECRKLQAGNCG